MTAALLGNNLFMIWIILYNTPINQFKNRIASKWVFDLPEVSIDDNKFWDLRNKIIESFRAFVGAKGLTKPVKFVKFATLIFKQFALPMEKTNALRYDKDVNFTGQPKYWANWDATTLIVAPTPNVAYTVEMWYDETAERLGNGAGTTSTTTFISNNAPEVLLYGTLSEAFSYLKNDKDMQLYTQKFQTALQAFANEQMGRKRRDEYVDGVLRVALPSADPKA